MNVLILGGTGFLGNHVTDVIVAKGHNVRIFDKSVVERSDVEFINADFSDRMALSGALIGIDVVIHMISTSVPSTSNHDPISDINGNLVNTINLLDLMRQANVSNLVYFSSGGTVYGIPDYSPMDENHKTNPICSYGIVKLAIEKYLHMYHSLYGISSTILRPSNPYGPGQKRMGVQGFIGTCLHAAVKNSKLTVWGDGSVIRDYIYVSDMVNATIKAMELLPQGVFNISSGKGYSLNEIILTIEMLTNKKINVEYREQRNFDVPEMILDNTKALKKLAWEPLISLDAGLKQSLSFFEDY
ncbi:NAD-dependent epimerase/dehydratase family protein [Methylophaga sulfidovorans]|uniref:UDP-glucose 4-epimerase n=1 Tax=Methylophaga sulfidovorans TaxID=45496 RepID=A0A1I3XMP0_9GAMM|nr:NAD-dependent epimerase/dehydratase family protein [Methylophaga sulfidovorans]SFK20793.1 UDP-glucose 4-epimerase [Methylophaga sulfidovorans]